MRRPPTVGSEDTFEFELLADEFESKPTLVNYLKIRERLASSDIVCNDFGDAASIYDLWTDSLDGCEHFGIRIGDVVAVVNGQRKSIDDLCVALGKAWQNSIELKKSGNAHDISRGRAISKATVNYLVSIALESAAIHEIPVPPSLAMLFREMNVGSDPAVFQRVRQVEKRFLILMTAFEHQRDFGTILSFGKLSQRTNIPKNTISQIFDGETNFKRELAEFSKLRTREPIRGQGVPTKS